MTYGASPSYNADQFAPREFQTGAFPVIDTPITVKSGAGVLVAGTVLGAITATGKAIVAVKTANDGSQAPTLILAFDVDATAADVVASAYVSGQFIFEGLTVDASFAYADLLAAWANTTKFIVHGSIPTDDL